MRRTQISRRGNGEPTQRGESFALIERSGRVAVLVPIEDLALLEAIEDRVDLAAARKALKEKGRIPWSDVKKELGLK